MACSVYIDSVEVITQRKSIKIDKRIEERSTASFVVVDELGTGAYVRGMPVEIYDSTPALIFAGFIDDPGKARMAPADLGLLHDISCMDNHYLADKRLVVNAYEDKTAGYIVEDIFDQYLAPEGVTIGEIQAGPTIDDAILNYVKVSEAYDAIKEASGDFTWFISDDKKLYFIDRATNAAPWNLDSATHRPIKDSVHLSGANPLYRNFQYIWGGTDITTLQTATFTGDGDTQAFALSYPLAKIPVVTEDAAPMDVGIKGIDTGKDYYWSKGDGTVYAEAAPGIGVAVEIQYYGQYPLISMSLDGDAIVARQAIEGGTGIVEDIVREAWHESKESSRQSAQAKLTQYCQEAEKFTYRTYESGLSPGQIQTITYAPFGFVNHDMLIESVIITTNGDLIYFDVSCITGPSMGSWSRLFQRMLVRQDQSIRVGGELLIKLLLQPETLTLGEATDIHSDDFSGGIVNRWISLPPAQSEGENVEHELLELAEAPAIDSHDTEDYDWDDADTLWDFFTWG